MFAKPLINLCHCRYIDETWDEGDDSHQLDTFERFNFGFKVIFFTGVCLLLHIIHGAVL